jgi:hypothetical protein
MLMRTGTVARFTGNHDDKLLVGGQQRKLQGQ